MAQNSGKNSIAAERNIDAISHSFNITE